MDEFKNENINNEEETFETKFWAEEEKYQETEEAEVIDEVVMEDKPISPKKGFKGVIAASLVFCMILGTVVGFNVGKFTSNPAKGGIISETNYAENKDEKLKQIAEKAGQELSTQEIAVKAGPAVVGVLSKVQTYNFWGQTATGLL